MLLQPFLAFQREPRLARLPQVLLYSNCKWLLLCAQMAYPLKMWGRGWGRRCFPERIKQFWKKLNLEVWFSVLHLRQEKSEQREDFPNTFCLTSFKVRWGDGSRPRCSVVAFVIHTAVLQLLTPTHWRPNLRQLPNSNQICLLHTEADLKYKFREVQIKLLTPWTRLPSPNIIKALCEIIQDELWTTLLVSG